MFADRQNRQNMYTSLGTVPAVSLTVHVIPTQSWSAEDGILQLVEKTVETKPKVALQCENGQTSFISAAVCAVVPLWKFVD